MNESAYQIARSAPKTVADTARRNAEDMSEDGYFWFHVGFFFVDKISGNSGVLHPSGL
jgi:hypothetical protein